MIPQPRPIGWQEAIDFFCADRVDLAETTRHVYRQSIDLLSRECTATPDKITRLDLLRHLQKYLHPGTYNNHLSAVVAFFRTVAEFYAVPDPSKSLKPKRLGPKTDPRIISPDEYQKILKHKGKTRDQCIFIANTGLRASEFLAVVPTAVKHQSLTVYGKGGKTRVVPLNTTALSLISIIRIPKSYFTFKNNLKTLADQLDLPTFGPHALRHYFATALIDRGANIASVSKILGHADIKTTITYYYHPTDLGDVVGLLDD